MEGIVRRSVKARPRLFRVKRVPVLRVRSNEVDVRYVWRYFSREAVWAEALAFSKGATPTSRNRLKEDAYLAMQIPLPPLEEQQRIATRIDELATKVDEARALRRDISQAVDSLFISKLKDVIRKQGHHVRYVPFTDIAHLERRPVDVKLDARYREIGVYSFGKGIFLKPPRTGAEIGNKALIEIRAGDLILQLTFAWEGAVALAEPAHDGLFGSVRYLTFRVNETFCSPRYLLIFLRTAEGKAQLEKISPGSAGRNRVLSLKRLNEVLVPIPPLETQRWLTDDLQAQMDALNRLQTETAGEMDALLPSIIDRAFKGELWC